ncbi:MAG TPA: terminase gpA endonuclease subunit [Guyparkeria sp.]|nr:terminase gpA endonuclease subunit [Guyparkeria sp.]
MTTLADAQAEAEWVRMHRAQRELDRATRASVSTRAAQDATAQVRAAVISRLDTFTPCLTDAVRDESDETRIHYLLSDATHDLLREIAATVADLTPEVPVIGQQVARSARPRDLLTVSQWAERHRVLKTGTNSPGPWRNNRTPYLTEIMDSLSEHSAVRQVTFAKSSGVGGSEVLFNWLGYIIHHVQNKDVMMVVPTIELRDRTFNPKLRKLFSESAAVGELVSSKSRDKKNSADITEFAANSRIVKSGANSADSLRAEHLPYIVADELDAYPWDVGGEGDPVSLFENRQRTYSRAKSYLVSTPTTAGESRITLQYERSDQRRYHVPCPECDEMQVLEFKHLQWRTDIAPGADAERRPLVQSAWMVCPECGSQIDELHKSDMLDRGRWIPSRPHIKRHRGYHINALYAPAGLGLGWKDVAQKWLDSQGDSAELKAFYNTYLGEVYREPGDSIEDIPLINRLENYQRSDLPLSLITAGVDVQKDRLEATVVGWGKGEECWILDHLILPGSPEGSEVWTELHDQLRDLDTDLACVDAGYLTDMVRQFVQPRAWTWAVKGQAGMDRAFIDDERKRKQRLRYRRRKGIPIEPVGVDQGKAMIYHRLRMDAPGPGYIHFPDHGSCDEEYFAQLASEKLVARKRGYRLRYEWVKTRPRNEALDCLIYAAAAMRLSQRSLGGKRETGQQAPAAPQPQKTPPTAPSRASRPRKVGKSDWSSSL